MARDRVKVWYDAKGDYLEVLFDQRPGYFRETTNDQVMEKVDAEGNVLGFSVLKVRGIGANPSKSLSRTPPPVALAAPTIESVTSPAHSAGASRGRSAMASSERRIAELA